jgi:hypothetical protein
MGSRRLSKAAMESAARCRLQYRAPDVERTAGRASSPGFAHGPARRRGWHGGGETHGGGEGPACDCLARPAEPSRGCSLLARHGPRRRARPFTPAACRPAQPHSHPYAALRPPASPRSTVSPRLHPWSRAISSCANRPAPQATSARASPGPARPRDVGRPALRTQPLHRLRPTQQSRHTLMPAW